MQTNKAAALVLLLGTCFYDDVRLFTKPRENWRAAAETMNRLATPGTCLIFTPASSLNLYLVFEKKLAAHECNDYSLQHASRIALATSPYGGATQMMPPDFEEDRRIDTNQPAVTLYKRK